MASTIMQLLVAVLDFFALKINLIMACSESDEFMVQVTEVSRILVVIVGYIMDIKHV